ncbi:MAG: phage tail tape measure protein, partial [Candidatus Thermoplasmatota archaeon]|nr:phage tail tape measure protein [Candidatus Thermoplasmatota archaeon]
VLGFAEFEQNIANSVTVFGEFGEEGMKLRRRLVEDITKITMSSRRMGSEAANAMYAIGSAGFSAAQAIPILTASVKLSEATLMDLTRTAESVMATLHRFRLGAEQSERAVNVLTVAIAKSPATMEKLEASLRYLGVTASAFDETLESTVALLMGFYKMGYQGSTAGMELAYALTQLSQQGKKFRDIAQGMGMDLSKLQPATHTFVEILEEFEKAQARVGETTMKLAIAQMFGLRSARAMRTALLVGSKAFREMEASITGTNLAAKMQADLLNTLQGQWFILRSRVERAAFLFASALEPALRNVIDRLNALVETGLDLGLFTRFGGILGEAVDDFLKILEPVAAPGFRFVERMLDVLATAFKEIGGVARAAVPSVQQLLDIIPGIAGDAVGALGPAFARVVSVVGPFFVEWVRVITPKMVELGVAVASLVEKFFTLAQPTILRWFTMLIELAIVVVRYFEQNIPRAIAFFETLIAAMPGLLFNFLGLLSEVARMVLVLTPIWLKFIAQLIRSLTDFLAQNGDKMLEWVDALLQMIVKLLEAAPQLFPAFQQFLDLLMRHLPVLLNNFIAMLPKMVELFQQFLDLVDRFVNIYAVILVHALERLLELVDLLFRDTAPAWLDALMEALPKILEIVDKVAALFDQILLVVQQLSNLFLPVLEKAGELISYLVENFRELFIMFLKLVRWWIIIEGLKLEWSLFWRGQVRLANEVSKMWQEAEIELKKWIRELERMPEQPSPAPSPGPETMEGGGPQGGPLPPPEGGGRRRQPGMPPWEREDISREDAEQIAAWLSPKAGDSVFAGARRGTPSRGLA